MKTTINEKNVDIALEDSQSRLFHQKCVEVVEKSPTTLAFRKKDAELRQQAKRLLERYKALLY